MSKSTSNQSDPFVEVREGAGSTCRDTTPEELAASESLKKQIADARAELEKAESKLKELEQGCQHIVRVDTAGWPYDLRHCHACGELLGSI